jgi:putative PIN family toxin of toxin-antitoxin system
MLLSSSVPSQHRVSHELLPYARAGAFLLSLADEILDEAQGVLLEEARRHRLRYHYPHEKAVQFVAERRAFAHLVTDLPEVTVISRDPHDAMVIATAQRAHAASIVTCDHDLVSLQH